jgi:hypothetical protein
MFKILNQIGLPNSWDLIYLPKEYSLDVSCVQNIQEEFTLLVNDLQIGLNQDGIVISIHGLCPHTSWNDRILSLPPYREGDLQCLNPTSLIPGTASRINPNVRWPIFVDREAHLICLDSGIPSVDTVAVSKDVLFGVGSDGNIVCLWLRPSVC